MPVDARLMPGALPSSAVLDQGGSAALRRGPASAPALPWRPAVARRASTRSKQPVPNWLIRPYCRIASAPPADDESGHVRADTGSLIRFRLCSPPGQAGQGRSLRSRRRGDGASAALDSPAPPGGFRSYRMRGRSKALTVPRDREGAFHREASYRQLVTLTVSGAVLSVKPDAFSLGARSSALARGHPSS